MPARHPPGGRLMAGKKQTAGDPRCKVRGCELTYSQHSGNICPACFVPIEHHDAASQKECWDNRARMAAARRAAGLELNAADVEALKKCPHPDTLTEHGYQVMETT